MLWRQIFASYLIHDNLGRLIADFSEEDDCLAVFGDLQYKECVLCD